MAEDDRRQEQGGPIAAYDRTVDRLATGLAPVARVWSTGRRLALWVACAGAVIVGTTMATPRPDLAAFLARPPALVELALLAAILVWYGAVAIRSTVPGGEPSVRSWSLVVLGLVLLAGLGMLGPVDASVSLADFVTGGLPCAEMTLALAGVATLVPLAMAGTGFPLAPRQTGVCAGLAGAVTAVLAMRLHCPLDETAHQLTFHASALVPLAAAGALACLAWQRLKTES